MIADFWSVVNNEFSVLEIYIQERDTMRIDATLISHCNNGINLNEDNMKTIGDRIEQLLRERGRARYEGAPPYTQVELVEMLTGKRPAPNGKYYSVTKVYYVGTELSAEDHRKLSKTQPKRTAPAIADPALFICQRMQLESARHIHKCRPRDRRPQDRNRYRDRQSVIRSVGCNHSLIIT